ncbi:MAG TPA: FUSC family protein, partial [Devosia sp.]|nr:FUSC family protein [Devosia sp.]
VPVAGLLLGLGLRSPLAVLYPTMMFGLMASNRKAFNLVRVVAAPVMFSGMIWLMSFVVLMFQGVPAMLVAILALFYFLACYRIQRTGNSMGMLIIAAAVMMSVMGISSYVSMDYLRVEMTKASFATAFLAPLLYWLLPTTTKELAVDVYVPADENGRVIKSAIRAFVLLLLSGYLYTILDSSNMMLAVGAMFVVVFPTRETLWSEALERSFSTLLGGVVALAILWLMTISAHIEVLVILVFLATLWFCQKMLTGRLSAMFYQYGASVMISTVGSALMTSEPWFTFVQRVVLTTIGAIVGAFAVSLLEALLVKDPAAAPPAATPATAPGATT